jgi:integrase
MNEIQLYNKQGNRLYLTSKERAQFLEAAKDSPREVRTFCAVMYYTGCRISEALQLTPRRVDFADKTLIFETLKKRRRGVYRAVPVPEEALDLLDMVHGIREIQKCRKSDPDKPIWNWSRKTGYVRIIEVMNAAQIKDGPHKCPKGLRHGYGVNAVSNKVPLNQSRNPPRPNHERLPWSHRILQPAHMPQTFLPDRGSQIPRLHFVRI